MMEGLRQRRGGKVAISPTNSVISTGSESEDADGGTPASEEEKIQVDSHSRTQVATTTIHHHQHDHHHQQQHNKDKSILEKLFSSKEEKNSLIPHVHKILGFSCLGSFIYRLAYLGKADCNFGPNNGTLFFILHHWLLNVSSFIFVIPQKRIRDGGYRIWPEYRVHSLVFASRALAFMLLRWYEQAVLHQGTNSRRNLWYMDTIIVLMTCAFADLGSHLQGNNHSNTVRGATFTDPFEQWFASQMQLYLTAFCLVGYRRYTLQLVALLVIQLNSFLMTLRRKNVAPHFVLTTCYTAMLVVGFFAIGMDDRYSHRVGVAATFGGVATLLRMGPLHVNKYVLWTGLGLIFGYIRTTLVLPFFNSWFWLYGTCITIVLSTLLGWYNRSKTPPESRNPLVGYLVFAFHFVIFAWLYILNFIRRGW